MPDRSTETVAVGRLAKRIVQHQQMIQPYIRMVLYVYMCIFQCVISLYIIHLVQSSPSETSTSPDTAATSSGKTNQASSYSHDPATLERQLFDPSLLRLWRTGAKYEIYTAEEDGDIDVRMSSILCLYVIDMYTPQFFSPTAFILIPE